MKQYRYVIVCCNGASYDAGREEGAFYPWGLGATLSYDLPQLLRDGWRPLRESPMGGTDSGAAYALVLLEKDA